MFLDINTENKIVYSAGLRKGYVSMYWIIIFALVGLLISLPFIQLDISVKTAGIIRPKNEKTELRSSVSNVIDTIYFKEGDTVKMGDVILQLRKQNINISRSMNDFEIEQRNQFIEDLASLTGYGISFQSKLVGTLHSPLYKQQCSRFVYQLSELNAQLKKVNKELFMDSLLSVDKVIAPKEMFDKKIEHEKLVANIRATVEQQVASWQQDLARFQLEKSQYQNANEQLDEDSAFYCIRSPISGVLQNFNTYYKGSLVQAGNVLAIVSPQAALIAECYINTRDVGLLKRYQQTLFQVDAFDYNYFGVLTGKVLSIDDDYTILDDKPVFKVRCMLDTQQLHLKNGFTGVLKKGMTLQARFVITKRSLWQLLFDKIDDWVNPAAP